MWFVGSGVAVEEGDGVGYCGFIVGMEGNGGGG